jgi:hypothetical protein
MVMAKPISTPIAHTNRQSAMRAVWRARASAGTIGAPGQNGGKWYGTFEVALLDDSSHVAHDLLSTRGNLPLDPMTATYRSTSTSATLPPLGTYCEQSRGPAGR